MRKAFTLIELLIVIAILAILAGAMIPMFNVTRQDALAGKVASELDAIKSAATMLHHDTGRWPPAGNGGTDFIADDSSFPDWDGPYLDEWKTDPWSTNYVIVNGAGTELIVRSCGPDATCGNGDDTNLQITPDRTN